MTSCIVQSYIVQSDHPTHRVECGGETVLEFDVHSHWSITKVEFPDDAEPGHVSEFTLTLKKLDREGSEVTVDYDNYDEIDENIHPCKGCPDYENPDGCKSNGGCGHDSVNHPSHYCYGGIECIDAIEAATSELTGIEACCTGNAIKYLWRWKQKNGAEDLRKAIWYISHLLEKIEEKKKKEANVPW